MKIGLYPRVSTQEQAKEGYSIGEQTERMKKYCEAMGWTVYNVYTDAGYSGGDTNRPGLQRMIKDVKAGKIDKVLVYKLDRLSRSQLDTLYLIEKVFLANNVDFVSMNENFDTSTPFGRAMIGILAVFAQLEREQIKERMIMGKDARAKEGKYHGSRLHPIGYDYINGELIINEYEAMQINKLFELALNNHSINSMSKYMNDRGYTHTYGKWNVKTVRRCLSNKMYIGYIKHNGEWLPGVHDSIVDQETFYNVQEIVTRRSELYKSQNRRAGKANSYLGGFLYCKHCGAKYTKNTRRQKRNGKVYVYEKYYCNSRLGKHEYLIKDPNCKNKNWDVDKLTNEVFDEIKKLAFDPDYISEIKDIQIDDTSTQIIGNEIKKIDTQIDKFMDLYGVSEMPVDVLQDRIHNLNERKTNLKNELIEIEKANKNKLSHNETIAIVQSFNEVLERGDFDEIRGVLSLLINKIVIDNDLITIHWNFA